MGFTFNFGGGFNPVGFGNFQNANSQTSGESPFQQPTPPPQKPKKPRKAIGNAFTRTLINLAVTLVVALVYFYLELPALNFHAEEFYAFIFILCVVYCVCAAITSGFQGEGVKGYVGFVKKQCTVPFIVFIGLIAAIAVGSSGRGR